MPTAMSTFDSGKEGLQDLLNEIHDAKLQLPDFQRDWRWDDEHICSLLASVSLSYPIGAVLLMETGGDGTHFAPRPVAGVRLPLPSRPQRLILDGQQRLTALYQVLRTGHVVTTRDSRNREVKRWYYLDIGKALDPNADREEAIVSVPEDKRVVSFGRELTVDLTDTTKECERGLLPLAIVFDIARLFQWLDRYTSHSDAGVREERKTLRDQLIADVIGRFQQYQIPVIELKQETPKEAVCRVFEKVNTGGVALDVFELVTATFAADNYSLRDDWLGGTLNGSRAAGRSYRIRRHAPLADVSATDFLMAATLLASWERSHEAGGAAVSCKRRDILRLSLSDYRRVADRLTQGFEDVARFLIRQKVFRASDVPYQTQLIPLAAIITALGTKAELDAVRQMLARWYWCGVLGELYGSAVESRFARDLPEVIAWIDGGPEPSTVQQSTFAVQRLPGLRSRNSAAYKGLYALLMREGAQDMRTGDPIELQTYFDDSIDIHHIFPRKVCDEMAIPPQKYNSVINKTPLAARTNRIIGGSRPSAYLQQLQKTGSVTEGRMNAILRSHLIEPGYLRSDDFAAFFEARAKALVSLIERATGKEIARALSADVLSAEVELEDNDEESLFDEVLNT